MIRLLTALAVFLFSVLWFLGEDHGQYIHPPRPAEATASAPAARPVFTPAKRVAGLPAGADPILPTPTGAPEGPAPGAAPDAADVAMALPEPAAAQPPVIRLMRAPAGATVRGGPGPQFPALGTLRAGFVVMVLDETSAPGWTRIRTDDGGAAWVAAGLLRE